MKALFFCFVVSIFFAVPNVSLGAFGASPPILNASRLVPGIKYQQTIYLARNDAENDLSIVSEFDLPPSIRNWVSIEEGNQFTIPAGVQQFPVHMIVQVPQGAQLGVYSGRVTFASVPDQSGQQVAISLGIEIPINVTVGNDISREVKVRLVKLLDIEEGWNPRVYVKLENLGNVPEKFDYATYELFDSFKNNRLAYAQKQKDFPSTPAFSTNEYTIEFPIDFHLGIGQYWGTVNFYQSDKVIGSQTTIFNVLKAGSISGPASLFLKVFDIQKYWIWYVGGFLALVILFFGYRRWRSKRK